MLKRVIAIYVSFTTYWRWMGFNCSKKEKVDTISNRARKYPRDTINEFIQNPTI